MSQDSRDDELLHELRAALQQAGEPTDTMRAAGEAAFSWRTIDAEIAALTYDSLEDHAALVRDGGGGRSLTFEGAGMSVELEQTADGLVGQLVPPTRGRVTLWVPTGELDETSTDALGCFSFSGARRGPVRLRCVTPSAELLTEWVQL
jgi:hypothetical protein